MFACHVVLAYHYGFNLVWFPGPAHQESNTDKGMMVASGLGHLLEKVNFLAKFNHGPFKGGRWLGVQKMAAPAFVEAVRNNDPVCKQLLVGQMVSICAEQDWAGPDSEQSMERALSVLLEIAAKHGEFPNTCRWFQDCDSAERLLKIRSSKGLLVDVCIMCQNASPWSHNINFADSLSVIFLKEGGNSLQVASLFSRQPHVASLANAV